MKLEVSLLDHIKEVYALPPIELAVILPLLPPKQLIANPLKLDGVKESVKPFDGWSTNTLFTETHPFESVISTE